MCLRVKDAEINEGLNIETDTDQEVCICGSRGAEIMRIKRGGYEADQEEWI